MGKFPANLSMAGTQEAIVFEKPNFRVGCDTVDPNRLDRMNVDDDGARVTMERMSAMMKAHMLTTATRMAQMAKAVKANADNGRSNNERGAHLHHDGHGDGATGWGTGLVTNYKTPPTKKQPKKSPPLRKRAILTPSSSEDEEDSSEIDDVTADVDDDLDDDQLTMLSDAAYDNRTRIIFDPFS